MDFVISRVREEDFDEIVDLQFKTFAHIEVHTALFGPNTREVRDACKTKFIEEMRTDAADFWMKAVDKTSGRIVSAAQWKIYPSWVPLPPGEVNAKFHKDKQARRDAEEITNVFFEGRERYMYGQPHVLLYLLFTDATYQRRGAGSIHVKWGCDLADRLMVPAFVEGTDEGHHLYQSNGFQDLEKVHRQTKSWLSEYTIMKREPKTRLDAARIPVPVYGHRHPDIDASLLSVFALPETGKLMSGTRWIGLVAIFGLLYKTSSRFM